MNSPKKIPLFGALALQEGHIDEANLQSLLREPLDTTHDDGSVSLCNLCLKRALITPAQAQQILLLQSYRELRNEDEALGVQIVQSGLADEEVVRYALECQSQEFVAERRLPRRLGTILAEAEVLRAEQFETVRAAWVKASRPPAPSRAPKPAPPSAAPTPKPPPEKIMAWLIVAFGDGIGRRIPIGPKTVIGRGHHGDVGFPDPKISRQHAQIEVDAATGQAVITDLGSRNGTHVNREKIDGPAILQSGDVIRVGMTALRFESGEEPGEEGEVPASGLRPPVPAAPPPPRAPAEGRNTLPPPRMGGNA